MRVQALGPTGPLAQLQRLDSVLKTVPLNALPHWNYDVALAFARRGEWRSAAAAARRRLFNRAPRLTVFVRDEGRWSALAGDTASAIRAFERYLMLRENPEPVLVPERDSIRAELARLRVGRPSRAP